MASAILSPAWAAEDDPLIARMDAYFGSSGFGGARDVETWRALSGKGDPRIEPFSRYQTLRYSDDPLTRELTDDISYSCRPEYAASIWRTRVATVGRDHPYARQWLAVQRAVFSHCEDYRDTPELALPSPLSGLSRELARMQAEDRAYQIASMRFYDGSPSTMDFAAIARSRSPHRPAARYMMLAIAARNAEEANSDARRRAVQGQAEQLLADPDLRSVHGLLQDLVGAIAWLRNDPALRVRQMDLALDMLALPSNLLAADPIARERYARALSDIGRLIENTPREPDWWLTGALPTDMHRARRAMERAKSDPLAAWLLLPASPFAEKRWAVAAALIEDDSYRRVRTALREQLPDGFGDETARVAALEFASHFDPDLWLRIDAMAARLKQHPTQADIAAYPRLFYHQFRTELMYSLDDQVARFAGILARLRNEPWPDAAHFRAAVQEAMIYLITMGRIADARALRGVVLTRAPDAFDDGLLALLAEDEQHFVAAFRSEWSEQTTLTNRLPIEVLARLAEREDLRPEVRARYARTAWARTYALGRAVPAAFDRTMRRLNPDLTAGWESKPGVGRPFDRALLLDVLRTPALNILASSRPSSDPDTKLGDIDVFEHSDNNWWCAWQPDRHRGATESWLEGTFGGADRRWAAGPYGIRGSLEPMLRQSFWWRSINVQEEEALAGIDCAPKLLAERAIAWTRKPGLFGRRRGTDEALALAVRSTRYGCQRQGGHGAYSRTAFQLLHSRYPGSPAAKRTKYWFDCSHFSGGCAVQARR